MKSVGNAAPGVPSSQIYSLLWADVGIRPYCGTPRAASPTKLYILLPLFYAFLNTALYRSLSLSVISAINSEFVGLPFPVSTV